MLVIDADIGYGDIAVVCDDVIILNSLTQVSRTGGATRQVVQDIGLADPQARNGDNSCVCSGAR